MYLDAGLRPANVRDVLESCVSRSWTRTRDGGRELRRRVLYNILYVEIRIYVALIHLVLIKVILVGVGIYRDI